MGEGRMAWDTLESISLDFWDEYGVHRRKQIKRVVLERRHGWALVCFLYEDCKGKPHELKCTRRVALHKYRYFGGGWRQHSAINLKLQALTAAAAFATSTED